MRSNFSICNSVRGNHHLGFTVTPVLQKREGESSVSFSYNHAAPSYPGDVMPETSKQIQVGEGGGDTRLYVLTATGTVDDQATISVAGQSYTSPSGAGVRINGSFPGIKAGFYTVSVSHINIDYPPRGNVSFLNCTVGPASAISITPEENRRRNAIATARRAPAIRTVKLLPEAPPPAAAPQSAAAPPCAVSFPI